MAPDPHDPDARTPPAGTTDAPSRRRAAKAPVLWAAGGHGQPLHPLIVTLPIGAWVLSFAFDLAARSANEELVYARGAFWLIGLGVVGGVAAAATGLLDLLSVTRRTPAFRTGLLHLGLSSFALLAFSVSFLLRRGADSLETASAPVLGLSVIALAALAVSAWLGVRLAFRYGVRVVDERFQDEGFVLPDEVTVPADPPPADPVGDPDETDHTDETDDDAEVTS